MDNKLFLNGLGFDLSTTGLTLIGTTSDNKTVFASVPIEGATTWHGGAAFDLSFVPAMFLKALKKLEDQGCELEEKGVISGSVRQHDMVLTDPSGTPLIPALSWQCNKATIEVGMLRQLGLEKIVGRIEERFVIAKLLWALRQNTGLWEFIHQVMTTGDWIGLKLTENARLGTSDGKSNGLMVQATGELAHDAITKTNIPLKWFPPVVKAGGLVGVIVDSDANDWGGRHR